MVKDYLFRFDANEKLGMGHTYRCIQLIESFGKMKSLAVIDDKSSIAAKILAEKNIDFEIISNQEEVIDIISKYDIQIVVNDILNTTKDYIQVLKKQNCRIVNLEDEGEGAKYADAVINELYEKENSEDNEFYGSAYYCTPTYLQQPDKNEYSDKVNKILVLFGCTDPGKFTEKTIKAISLSKKILDIETHVIVGPGNDRIREIHNIAKNHRNIHIKQNVNLYDELKNADIAISSQGRTIFELACMCIPTIIMAQNVRELQHTFAAEKNGFLNLGLGSEITEEQLSEKIDMLIENAEVRKIMYDKMSSLSLEKSLGRVKDIIMGDKSL